MCSFLFTGKALAVAVDSTESLHFRLLDPVENNTAFRVWGNRYYPNDVLSQKMTEYFFRRLRMTPAISSSLISPRDFRTWETRGFSKEDAVVKLKLERFDHSKDDRIGSRLNWDIGVRMTIFSGNTREPVFNSVIRNNDSRHRILYTEVLEHDPVYWEQFEQTDFWHAIARTLDMAYDELMMGYTGYRIIGQIVAKAERVDGSLTVPKGLRDRLYHVTIGRNQSLRQGDILVITRASAVRTLDASERELHFPQIVARARVFFLKDNDAIVEIIKESSDAPVQLGDAVSVPIAGSRRGRGF